MVNALLSLHLTLFSSFYLNLQDKDYGKPRMLYSDFVATPSGLQYQDIQVREDLRFPPLLLLLASPLCHAATFLFFTSGIVLQLLYSVLSRRCLIFLLALLTSHNSGGGGRGGAAGAAPHHRLVGLHLGLLRAAL
jgi:hypothetical protein